MTLPEKVLQLPHHNAPAIPVGVQQYTYWMKAARHQPPRRRHRRRRPGSVDDVHATSFPVNFASSMSWDRDLMYQETTAISTSPAS